MSSVSSVTPSSEPGTKANTTTNRSSQLPAPGAFSNPYAQSPLFTPATGNPLLGDFRKDFTNYDDRDDTDIPQSQRQQAQNSAVHSRAPSAAADLRTRLGLTLTTSRLSKHFSSGPHSSTSPLHLLAQSPVSAQSPTESISSFSVRSVSRTKKPAPLPLRVNATVGQEEVDGGFDKSGNMSPVSMRSQIGEVAFGAKRHSLLRRVFPAH